MLHDQNIFCCSLTLKSNIYTSVTVIYKKKYTYIFNMQMKTKQYNSVWQHHNESVDFNQDSKNDFLSLNYFKEFFSVNENFQTNSHKFRHKLSNSIRKIKGQSL